MRLPLIGGILALGCGIGLIVGYGKDLTGFSAAYPFSGSMLHLDIVTTGPGVLGGVALIALGVILLIWAFLAAIVSVFTGGRYSTRKRVVNHYSVVPADETDALGGETRHFWNRPASRTHL